AEFAKNSIDSGGESLPGSSTSGQFTAARLRDSVHFARRTRILRLPLTFDPTVALQRTERGIQCTLSHLQGIRTAPLDLPCDSVTVAWPLGQHGQEQGRRIPLNQLSLFIRASSRHIPYPVKSLNRSSVVVRICRGGSHPAATQVG